jgi:adenylylsulfate reductase subunit A
MKHIQFREESRYPGYYYRADFLDLDDDNWKCFVNSTYDRDTGEWTVFKKQWKRLVSVGENEGFGQANDGPTV